MSGDFPWLRLYVEITTDRRMRRRPVAHRWAWVACLVLARKSERPGFLILEGEPVTAADLADEAAIAEKDARMALEWFREKGYIVDRDGLPSIEGWERRQPSGDSSTERVRRFRQRQKDAQRNVSDRCLEPTVTGAEGESERETEPPRAGGSVASSSAGGGRTDLRTATDTMQRALGRALTTAESDTVSGWCRLHSLKLIEHAIATAAARGKLTVGYTGGIIVGLAKEGWRPADRRVKRHPCSTCNGRGLVTERIVVRGETVDGPLGTCPRCKGAGREPLEGGDRG